MPDDFSFADDDKKAASPPPKTGFSWDADDPTHAEARARVAQPTQFEKARADASATPGLDTLKGFGEGALKTAADVGWGISKIPVVGSHIIPAQGLAAEQKLATPRTAGEKLGSNIEGVAEAALPVGEAIDAVKGSKFVRPAAQFLSENVLPEIKSLPYVGRGIEAAEKAPNFVKAAIRGGTTGATVGGLEQAIRTGGDPYETAKGALYGGAGGATLGAAAHGISRLANRIPEVSEAPFELTAPPAEREPAVQQQIEFPKVQGASAAPPASQPYSAGMPSVREPGRAGPPLQRLEELIQQASGTPPGRIGTLEPATPLHSQPPQSVGAAAEGFAPAVDPMRNVPLREQRQLQKPFGNRAAVEVSEMHGPRTVAPEKIPQVLSNTVDEAMGGEITPEAKERARLQEKYPDAGDRQQIHRTSEKIFEATRDDPKLRKALGDLPAHDNKGGPDLARAAANLGEDLGERRIGNKKAEWMGAGQIGRGEMFDRLLDKGYTAQEIFDASQAELKVGKPGLMRAARKPAQEKTGD